MIMMVEEVRALPLDSETYRQDHDRDKDEAVHAYQHHHGELPPRPGGDQK